MSRAHVERECRDGWETLRHNALPAACRLALISTSVCGQPTPRQSRYAVHAVAKMGTSPWGPVSSADMDRTAMANGEGTRAQPRAIMAQERATTGFTPVTWVAGSAGGMAFRAGQCGSGQIRLHCMD